MSQTILTQVHEYALTLTNSQDNDTQKLTAAFPSLPSSQDWKAWLNGWIDCGYSLQSPPQLIRTI